MLRSIADVDAVGSTASPAAQTDLGPRPPLKWLGGKRWQIQHLLPYWTPNAHRRLVEPFCGGLAVALGLKPARALLNDVNPHLINFYSQLKRGLVPSAKMVNKKAPYYAARDEFNALLASGRGDTERAAELFYYLNRTGYNGLCRFNSKGVFNVPFGRYKTINYFEADDFQPYVATFRRWEFSNVEFDEMRLAPDDFVYADPPYDVEFTHYSQGGFSWDDQVRAATWLAKHRGPVVLSNQATPKIKKLYESLGYSLTLLAAPRRVSCTGDRTPASEVLATRNLPDGP
ncbi:MAG TPA: Dam family site-specific DNA-(adenine-N6)-methyltransferase [Vicinamibacterales bacterium]|nr:Dam family site-specific DNA-(adenine-N6)-methyltransferase [Vicinamibacterales bacterium]